MKLRTLPNLVEISRVMTEVVTGKVNVTFAELTHGPHYTKFNPRKLRLLNQDHPLRVFQNTLVLPPNEPRLKAMIDSALYEMCDTGIVERSLRKYEPASGTMYCVATPYVVPKRSTQR